MPWSLTEHPTDIAKIFTSFLPGYRLVDGEDLLIQANLLFSAKEAARGGTGVNDALPLEAFITQVVAGTSCVLPPAVPGRYVAVVNDTPGSLQVYGLPFNPVTGLADTVAGSSSSVQSIMALQPPAEINQYFCFAPGLWKQLSGAVGAGGPGGGIPEAPITGVVFGRQNGGWVPVLSLAGGALTGDLILSSTQNTTNPNAAVSINYIANLSVDEGTY